MKDYKKILEGVVNIINTAEKSDIGFANICTYIGENCPELKGSEYEMMIQYFKDLAPFDNADELYEKYGFSHKDAIAWLEKQCEHKIKTPEESLGIDSDTYNKIVDECIYGEQKPDWSKEDEEIHRKCICAMRASACGFPEEEKFVEQVDNWLKSIKYRVQVQPQNKWISVNEEVYVKEPVLAQKKDKSDQFGGLVVCCDHTLTPNVYERYMILGNIVSQNTLKPSDEQIEALEHFIRSIGESGYASPYDNNTKLLYSLLSDLKKLNEE